MIGELKHAPGERKMSERDGSRSGGIDNSGTINSGGGDITGRDKIVGATSTAALEDALRPLIEAVRAGSSETRGRAEAKLEALKSEASKGGDANDKTVADLVDGLVELVPEAASAAVSAFSSPILGGIVGPVTRFVLRKLGGK
jgi:hypothetical protein